MYGDATAIRRLAGGLREQAGEIRTEADRLVTRTDAAGWLGEAGDALRDRVRERALALRRSAALHDDAAEALERHAHEVERLQRLIEEIERRVHRLVEAARDKLDDWVTGWLDRFEPPPHGSRRWLEIEVPGL
jgi:phage host-nuclease inhibitor protein Gam